MLTCNDDMVYSFVFFLLGARQLAVEISASSLQISLLRQKHVLLLQVIQLERVGGYSLDVLGSKQRSSAHNKKRLEENIRENTNTLALETAMRCTIVHL